MVQLRESVQSDVNLKGKLWEREKYWPCQLSANIHGMNSVSDLYSSKTKILLEKLIALGLLIYVTLIHCLHNCF